MWCVVLWYVVVWWQDGIEDTVGSTSWVLRYSNFFYSARQDNEIGKGSEGNSPNTSDQLTPISIDRL